jgi:AcrR family transcriptional regulator
MIDEQKKLELVEIAYDMVKVHGWNNISMRKLSSEANTSLPIIYRLVGNKESLMLEVVKKSLEQLESKLEFIASNSSLPVDDAVELLFDYMSSNPFVFEYLYKKEMTFQSAIQRKKILDTVTSIYSTAKVANPSKQAATALSQIIGQLILDKEFTKLDKQYITLA